MKTKNFEVIKNKDNIKLNVRGDKAIKTALEKLLRLKNDTKESNSQKLRPLQRLSLFFFERPKITFAIWLVITVFGIASYTTFLKREGFPSVNTPFSISQGTYLVNDADRVDKEVAQPLNEFLLSQPGVKQVLTQSFDNFFVTTVAYNDDVNAEQKSQELNKQIADQKLLPPQAVASLEPFKFGFTPRGDDVVLSVYTENGASTKEINEKAKEIAEFIKSKNIELIGSVSAIEPFESAVNPMTGQEQITQKSFDRFGVRQNEASSFFNSVSVGVDAKEGTDNLELDAKLNTILAEINASPQFQGYKVAQSASYAPQIREQVSELQKVLLEGLLAVLLVGSIVIAIRASLITVISMITVLTATIGLLYLLGNTLNTITLFALILGLSLIVDDTIIMIEAIDAERKRRKDPKKIVATATKKISRAMVAATFTAALSFAPLIFVSGILGKFIRAIPTTIISALLISLLVSLIFIPFFAKFILLGKKHVGKENVKEIAAGFEAKIAELIAKPMLWAKGSSKKLITVGVFAVLVGFGFIFAGGAIFQKVTFNIFPPSKDSNQLSITLTYPPSTKIDQAEATADKANKIIADELGGEFVKASYYGQANVQAAVLYTDITSYQQRSIAAPQLVDQLNSKFQNFEGANVKAAQVDAGPPSSAFTARVDSSKDRPAAIRLANDVAKHLRLVELKRIDGTQAKLESVEVTNTSIYNRDGNNQYVEISAKFVDSDTTTLVTIAKDSVEKAFPEEKVATYGLDKKALSFNFGQEDENQDSFKTLAYAFPMVLTIIFVLLAVQFRSLLQPLLIFMAIPFSFFGISLGLYITDNAFSFFTMMGFFALIGLSIKNTILLTDYANQSRKSGMGPIDAAHAALAERFRPLIATSLTAVFSLIPLTITSPFWEGLGVVLIFGPYYYLGSEYLRMRVSRKAGIAWIVLTIGLMILIGKFAGPASFLAPFLAVWILKSPKLIKKYRSKAA
ncbi:efflux RND transporter permease subunit [Candidatus Saccharibacteria bacterium]|nr:efflux RND transporter permease subunit [Candidatus Saccharibacteria bacterium]